MAVENEIKVIYVGNLHFVKSKRYTFQYVDDMHKKIIAAFSIFPLQTIFEVFSLL